MDNAQWLAGQVDGEPGWERLAPVPLQTVCLRHVPATFAGDEAALTAHNRGIAERINQDGRFYLTSAELKGRQIVRVSIGAQATERVHVEALWRDLRSAAEALSS
jgi:aromatic-L-amino-acid decarboxylase